VFIDLWLEGMACCLHVRMDCYLHVCSPLCWKAWSWARLAGRTQLAEPNVGSRCNFLFKNFYEQHNKPKKIKCEFYYNF